jgi:hypothetical protein
MKRLKFSPSGSDRKLRSKNKSNYAESLELPTRWRALLGGFLIVLGVRVFCSDPVGNLRVPTQAQFLGIAPVVLVAFLMLYIDWKKKTSRH